MADTATYAGAMKIRYHSRMAKPNPKAPLGSGGRFAAIEAQAAANGAKNPAAVAAAAGIKKYGKAKMAQLSAKGRAAAAHKKRKHGK